MRDVQAARGTSLTDEQRIERRSSGWGTRRQVIVLFCVAAAVAVLDQVSKAVVVATMPGREPVHVLGDFLEITYTRNPGAAFSWGTGFTVALSVIALAVVALIVRMSTKLASVGWAIALGGILGGAVGNLVDRLVRSPGPLRGYVVDWISIPHWPVFNIADSAIVCSAGLMVVLSLRGVGLTGKVGQ